MVFHSSIQIIPLQLGPPSPYCMAWRNVFVGICCVQVLMGLMCMLEFFDFISGTLMILALLFAMWAVKEHMNITYIIVYGIFSFGAAIATAIQGLLPMILSTVQLRFSAAVARVLLPAVNLAGAILAWLLYRDYHSTHGGQSLLDQFLMGLHLLPPPADDKMPLSDPNQMMAGMVARGMGGQMAAQKDQMMAGYGSTNAAPQPGQPNMATIVTNQAAQQMAAQAAMQAGQASGQAQQMQTQMQTQAQTYGPQAQQQATLQASMFKTQAGAMGQQAQMQGAAMGQQAQTQGAALGQQAQLRANALATQGQALQVQAQQTAVAQAEALRTRVPAPLSNSNNVSVQRNPFLLGGGR